MKCIKQVQYWPESIVEHPYHPHLRDATELDLSQAKLVALPERFGEQLVNLTELNLHCCVKLQELPGSICNMRSLTKLDLSGVEVRRPMSLRALPEGFGKMASLEDLSLAYCHTLVKNEGAFTILSQIPTLTKLNLSYCDMESLPAGNPAPIHSDSHLVF